MKPIKIVINREEANFSTYEKGDVRRDVYSMQETENLVTGITLVHPHSRTNGHSHPYKEEHYFIVTGSGYIQLDNARYEIHTGDDVCVPPVSVHTVVNPNDEPLEFFWAATPGEPKISAE
jgi:mannose-6-phosphate isomerase-like protein (cupin superfamily)